MARFKCINENCPSKDKEVIVGKVKWVFNSVLKKLISSEPIICSDCGEVLEFVANTTIPNLTINAFDSLSSDQKRAVINKRASNHLRKSGEIKEINEKKKNIIEDNKRMMGGKL